MTLPDLVFFKKLFNVIFNEEIICQNGNVVQLISHNGKWFTIPTIIVKTIKNVGNSEYEVQMIHDDVLEIIGKFPNASEAFVKHHFISAKLGLKKRQNYVRR